MIGRREPRRQFLDPSSRVGARVVDEVVMEVVGRAARALTVRHADRRQRVVRQLDVVEDRDRLGDAVSLREQLRERAVAELVAARFGDRFGFEDLDRDRVLDGPRRKREVLCQQEAGGHRA